MSGREREIIRLLLKHARVKMRRYFRVDSCIAATKIAIDVLAHFNIQAEPQPVRLYVANRKLWVRLMNGTYNPDEGFQSGEHSIGIGYGTNGTEPKGGGFNGHMVAVFHNDDAEWLIDLSLDQVSRPQRGIVLEPAVFQMPNDWRAGERGSALRDRAGGTFLQYTPMMNELYHQAPDWLDTRGRIAPIVKNVVSIISKRIHHEHTA